MWRKELELFCIVFFGATTVISAVAVIAGRKKKQHKPALLDFKVSSVDAYDRIYKFVSHSSPGAHTWKVKEEVAGTYLTAELNFVADELHKCDALINFDFIQRNGGESTVRWSYQLLHWADRATQMHMQELIQFWIETCLIPEIPVPPSAVPTELPTRLKTAPSFNIASIQSSMKDKVGAVNRALTEKGAIAPIIQSPDPLSFQVSISEAYQRIKALVDQGIAGAYEWKLTDEIEDAYIVAVLKYRNDQKKISFETRVSFDFSEPEAGRTMVRWASEFLQWYPEQVTEPAIAVIDNFITMAVSNEAREQAAAIARAVPSTGGCKSGYPRDFVYTKLLRKLSDSNDPDTKWKLKECFSGRSISADVEYKHPDKITNNCKAEITIEFRDSSGGAAIDWTYKFEPAMERDAKVAFKALTDEWLELVMRR